MDKRFKEPFKEKLKITNSQINITAKPDVVDQHSPLLSVYMASYNHGKYICDSIQSVLDQSFVNFELIIVDDGSTDETLEIVKKFDDHRITLIQNEHKGFANAMNTAISAVKSELIIGVDSDDLINSNYIENMMSCVKEHPDYDYYYPEALSLIDSESRATGVKWQYTKYVDADYLIKNLFTNGCSVIPNAGSIKRKNLFSRYGLYEEVETSEDYLYLCKNAKFIRFFKCDNVSGYNYRRHSSANSLKIFERCKINSKAMWDLYQKFGEEYLLDSSDKFKTAKEVFESQAEKFREKGGSFFKSYADQLKQ